MSPGRKQEQPAAAWRRRVEALLEDIRDRLGAALPPEPVAMSLLPDELLLLVLSLLDNASLLEARAVCRRWHRLALSPALWRSRALTSEEGSRTRRFVLRWAPCLRSAEVGPGEDLDAVQAGPCAIRHLTIRVFDENASHDYRALSIARALAGQVRLGSLRGVKLQDVHAAHAWKLLYSLQRASLERLEVRFQRGVQRPPVKWEKPLSEAAFRRSALRVLKYWSPTPDPVVEDLLLRHAATLEEVSLAWNCSARAVDLLASCPRLRKTDVPPAVAASAYLLRGCLLLRTLSVDVAERAPQQLLEFLRGAVQLEKLKFYDTSGADKLGDMIPLLFALGSSRKSALRKLVLDRFEDEEDDRYLPLLPRLPVAMCGLRQLRTIKMDNLLPIDVLDAIDSGCAPSLRLLAMNDEYVETCRSQSRCFIAAVVRLTRRIPGLHVTGMNTVHLEETCFSCDRCDCCAQSFHELIWDLANFIGVCSHDASERCDVAEHEFGSGSWLCV